MTKQEYELISESLEKAKKDIIQVVEDRKEELLAKLVGKIEF